MRLKWEPNLIAPMLVLFTKYTVCCASDNVCTTQLLLSPPAGCLLAVEIERGFDVPILLQLSK